MPHTSPSVFFSTSVNELDFASASTASVISASEAPGCSAAWRRTFSSWYSNQVRTSVPYTMVPRTGTSFARYGANTPPIEWPKM